MLSMISLYAEEEDSIASEGVSVCLLSRTGNYLTESSLINSASSVRFRQENGLACCCPNQFSCQLSIARWKLDRQVEWLLTFSVLISPINNSPESMYGPFKNEHRVKVSHSSVKWSTAVAYCSFTPFKCKVTKWKSLCNTCHSRFALTHAGLSSFHIHISFMCQYDRMLHVSVIYTVLSRNDSLIKDCLVSIWMGIRGEGK